MAEGDVYFNCTNTDIDAESLLRYLAVDSDGNLYIDCDNDELDWESIFRQMVVEDATGNPALAIYGVGGTGGTAEHHEFTAAGLQTTFDTTPFFNIDANYKVFVDGLFQSWGHTRVGNVITFVNPFVGGEEISVHQ